MFSEGLLILVTGTDIGQYITRKNDGNYFKSFCHSVQNQRREGKREKKLEWVKLEPPP